MKLLLINTPINLEETMGSFSSIYDDMKMVPTGIGYLAAYVQKEGINVRVLDQYAECLPMEQVYAMIDGFKPGLIGYSATTPNYFAAVGFLRKIKARFPNIPSVMGGYHPSVMPEQTLANDEVDYVIRDEGEEPLLGLCKSLEKEEKCLDQIPGLSYKENGVQRHIPSGPKVNLDNLPFPAYDLLPMHKYSSVSYTKFATPVFQMIASRGCPYTCTFCINAELDVSALYRKRNVELVVREMEFLADTYGAKQIQFWDPIFPLGKKHALEFCEAVIKRGLHKRLVWNCTTRAELVTDEMVKAMVAAGCRGIGFGIESGAPELLARVNKKSSQEKIRNACRIATKRGLVVVSGFIFGFPGETKETVRKTVEFAKSLDLHYAQFSIMVPYPGTPLFKELVKSGELRFNPDESFERFNQSVGLTEHEPVYLPAGWTAAELKKAQKDAYVSFYLRPIMVLMHLPHLRLSTLVSMIRSFNAIVKLAAGKFAESLRM